jgi:DivIVA domain-containing protein
MTEGRLAPEEVRTRTFSRVVRGYRRREVRKLLERAADDLARLRNGPVTTGPDGQPPLTPEDVEEVRFQPSLGGYEMDEVDQFLDQLMVELERAAHEPLRPPSALPAPPRHAAFPPLLEEGPVAGMREPEAPPPPPVVAEAAAAGPPPAPEPPVAGPPPPTMEPATAGSEEGWFPPPSAPPSSAPAPPPPPPAGPVAQPVAPGRPLTPSEVEARSFNPGAPGYLPAHVDLFLAKAARALAGRDGETITRWDILRQRFPLGPRGYVTTEVDAFLVRLATQFPDPDPETQQEILRKLQDR